MKILVYNSNAYEEAGALAQLKDWYVHAGSEVRRELPPGSRRAGLSAAASQTAGSTGR